MKLFFILLSTVFFSLSIVAQSTISLPNQETPDLLENIQVNKLFTDSLVSSFTIWIKDSVKMHTHKQHSEHVYIIAGKGIMTIGKEKLNIKTGDLIYIPANTIHALKVTSKTPMKVLSFQAPEFVGKDRFIINE